MSGLFDVDEIRKHNLFIGIVEHLGNSKNKGQVWKGSEVADHGCLSASGDLFHKETRYSQLWHTKVTSHIIVFGSDEKSMARQRITILRFWWSWARNMSNFFGKFVLCIEISDVNWQRRIICIVNHHLQLK